MATTKAVKKTRKQPVCPACGADLTAYFDETSQRKVLECSDACGFMA